MSARTQTAVILLAVAVVGIAVWRFWPAAPAPEARFDAARAPAEGGAVATESTTAVPVGVVVHVVGAVMRPGVYSLAAGARVVDAVETAGGGLGNAALAALNLARILSDGEQVYVPTGEEVAAGTVGPSAATGTKSGTGGAQARSGGAVNLNTATAADLDTLPGVGPATAQKIVDDREANGPFATPEDLMRVSGIGAKKFDALKDLVTCR